MLYLGQSLVRTGVLICAASLWLLLPACGSSSGVDDDATVSQDGTPPGDGATGTDGSPPADGSTGDPVWINVYELEIGVNTDEANGDAIVRWYGSFYPVNDTDTITNVSVSSLEIVENGALRTVTSAAIKGTDPIDALPGIQKRVWGILSSTAEELSTCQSSGPGLHRGNWSTGEIVTRLCGTSDQGAWCSEDVVDNDRMIRTCHTGVSGLAGGSAYVWDDPGPPAGFWVDLSANVSVMTPFDYDPIVVTSLVVRGEGTAESFEAPLSEISGSACYGTLPECFVLYYMDAGHIGEALCPDWETGFPPELYITYAGTAAGRPFAGAAPAGQCATGTP